MPQNSLNVKCENVKCENPQINLVTPLSYTNRHFSSINVVFYL